MKANRQYKKTTTTNYQAKEPLKHFLLLCGGTLSTTTPKMYAMNFVNTHTAPHFHKNRVGMRADVCVLQLWFGLASNQL